MPCSHSASVIVLAITTPLAFKITLVKSSVASFSPETAAGTILFPENREIVTLRGIVPGEYVVNVHCYFKVAADPVPVTIQIDKINPYSVVLRETVDLANKGEEITVTRFSVNSKGEVTNVNKLPKKLVQEWQKG